MKRGGFLQRKKPWNPVQKPLKRSIRPKAKKQTKVDLWRQYGLERPSKSRYSGLKGIYWWLLSRKVRQRDFNTYGTCISCGKQIEDWKLTDCGHYIPAMTCGFELLFDEKNLHMECKYCNGIDEGHLIGYERGLDTRYGPGTAKKLEDRYWKHRGGELHKEWSQLQYDIKIKELLVESTTP